MQETNPSIEPSPPRFRKLRIAWSVAWGIVAVLLVALWVWSYLRTDLLWKVEKPGIYTKFVASSGIVYAIRQDFDYKHNPQLPKIPRTNRWVHDFKGANAGPASWG